MSFELRASISGHDRVADAIRSGIQEGLKETGQWLLEKGSKRAQDRVRATDRVWRRRVYHGFSGDGVMTGSSWEGTLRNEAPHAEIVEKGLAPAGEITGANPSVQDILPWVSDKLSPQSLDQSQNVSDWHPDLRRAAREYGAGYVLTAFAVKKKLDEEGYPGIGFMDAAETHMNRVGPMVLHRKVEKNIERELGKRGI